MPSFRPTNFSWVIDGVLSGCAYPSHGGHFQYLVENGVRHLVTLTRFTPPLHLMPKGVLNSFCGNFELLLIAVVSLSGEFSMSCAGGFKEKSAFL